VAYIKEGVYIMMNKQFVFLLIATLSMNSTWTMDEASAEFEADSYAKLLGNLQRIETAIGQKDFNEVRMLIKDQDYSKAKVPSINNPLYLSVVCNHVDITQDLLKAGLPADERIMEIVDDVDNDAAFALRAAIKEREDN